jgi:hypothetical protein
MHRMAARCHAIDPAPVIEDVRHKNNRYHDARSNNSVFHRRGENLVQSSIIQA